MSDNSFEYITTDYMVSVNPIEDTQSPIVEYIVELGQQGLPGAKGEPGEPGFSPVVTSVIDDDTIRFTLVNKDEVTTTPNFYDLLAKKDLSNTTYADDMANKLDKDGTNADSPITLNKLIITAGTTMVADVLLSTTHNRNININAPIRTINNIQLSPSGTTGIVTYKGNELATLDDIPEVPDVSNFLNKDGSNAASTIGLQNISLAGKIQTAQPSFYISNTRNSDGNITIDTFNGDIYLSPDSSHKLYYRNKEIATLSDIPTVGNGVITIKQGDVTKGTFTTNQSGNATIELDEGGGSGSYTDGNGINIINNVISIDDTVALKTDIPDVSNFVTNTSLATTLTSYVTTGTLVNTLSLYARKDQLEAVAFSGDYDDLINQPTIGNGTITFTQGGVTKGIITTNQTGDTTIDFDGGGGGGVTNPIALSESIGGNTYNLNIGIDKTTGNLQGTYSYPVSGGTDTLPLFSRSYGLVNAGLSNNYTTVNGYQTNQLSVKVDNSTIGFNNNGALTVTGSYASTTDLDDKVSKSGDTMTGDLTLEDAGLHSVWTDADTTVTPSTTISHDPIIFQDVNSVGMTYLGFVRYANGNYASKLSTRKTGGGWSTFEVGYNPSGDAYCNFPNTKRVDGQWINSNKELLSGGNLTNGDHTYSLSSYLPTADKYEVLVTVRGRTGSSSGNYVIANVGSNAMGYQTVASAITRSSSYVSWGSTVIVPVGTDRVLKVNLNCNATATETYVVCRGYRRIGINA